MDSSEAENRQGEAMAAFQQATGHQSDEQQDQGRGDDDQGKQDVVSGLTFEDRQDEALGAFQEATGHEKDQPQERGDEQPDREAQAMDAFTNSSKGRLDNTQGADRADGPEIDRNDELGASVDSVDQDASKERGQAIHDAAMEQAKNRGNDGPSR